MQKAPQELIDRLVKPHRNSSRDVTKEDTGRIIADYKDMYDLLHSVVFKYNGGFAIAHSQVCEVDPLRFFVLNDGRIICNPEIIRHTQNFVEKKEACLTFCAMNVPSVYVERFNKCEVKYLEFLIETDEFIEKQENLSGKDAQVFQHEIDHMNAKYILDESYSIVGGVRRYYFLDGDMLYAGDIDRIKHLKKEKMEGKKKKVEKVLHKK